MRKIIYVVCRDMGKLEQDIELCRAFYSESEAKGYADTKDLQLSSQESHIFYFV